MGDIKKAFGIVSPSEDTRKHNEQVGKWIEQGMSDAFLSLDEIKKEQKKYKLYGACPIVDCDSSRTNVAERKEEITAMLDKVAQQVRENTEMWIICEMAKQWVLDQKRHGKWKVNNYGEHICPICGHYALYAEEADGYYEVQSNFCPNCGEKMDKEDK